MTQFEVVEVTYEKSHGFAFHVERIDENGNKRRTLVAGGGTGGVKIDGVDFPARLGGTFNDKGELEGAESFDWTWWSILTKEKMQGAHTRDDARDRARKDTERWIAQQQGLDSDEED